MATVAYKRVSTTDQKTDRQLADLNISFDKVFEDKTSGKDTKRPQLQAMLEYIREGDSIYIHSLDRLARNNTDLQKLVDEITKKGVSIHFVKENLDFKNGEQQTSINKLMFQLLGCFAEFERNLIKERQREGIAKAKEKGIYKGRKPIDKNLFDKTLELIHSGVKTSEAIKQTGISESTYFRYLKKQRSNENLQ